MNVTKIETYVVNDADTYIVDRDGRNRLLWDMNDDDFAIGYGLKGESEDGHGYIDMLFERVEVFKAKREAMERWVSL